MQEISGWKEKPLSSQKKMEGDFFVTLEKANRAETRENTDVLESSYKLVYTKNNGFSKDTIKDKFQREVCRVRGIRQKYRFQKIWRNPCPVNINKHKLFLFISLIFNNLIYCSNKKWQHSIIQFTTV